MTTPAWLTHPTFHTRAEILGARQLVPSEPGLYGWFFLEIPPGVPTDGCISYQGWTLLYLGISPSAPPKKTGRAASKQNLRKRIDSHICGNASGSTLRKTLGCLLAEGLGYPLRRVGSGKRLTLTHLGEQALDAWLDDHAAIAWHVEASPWISEERLTGELSLPLNIQGNEQHPFHDELRAIRSASNERARQLPIASESGTNRSPAK
jgi:hypothetical protein